ncbi:hypothetical protein [Curtobacterium sp. MCBA15_009]|uniref:hypothetical protein n=1 Tax=Curtobacterium sp. MCBA15_009 TaxID=1898737 RepID=UPI0011135D82|nr:hypothetical protein [Curtobacterium sp. MCBA15_009]
MSAATLSQAADNGGDVLAQYGVETINVDRVYVAGVGYRETRPLVPGDPFILTLRQDDMVGARVYADRFGCLEHLKRDGRQPGYQWGDDEAPEDDELNMRFTYLGDYEFVSTHLDPGTLEITLRFRRTTAEGVPA